MIENVRKYPFATIVVISIYYTVGVVGLSLELSRPLFQKLIPVTLLFSLYFTWLFEEKATRGLYLGGLIIFLLGFFVEVVGVNTGYLFGHYIYGQSLGFKLWNTPLVIGVNWLLLIYTCRALIGLFTSSRWLTYIAGGTMMVLYDLVLEPIAIRFDMWNWHNVAIPVQNYVAWFLISLVFFVIFDLFARRTENKIAPAMFIIQFMFFAILNIIFYFI